MTPTIQDKIREVLNEIIRDVRRSPTNYDYESNIEHLVNQSLISFTKIIEEEKRGEK